MHGTGLVDGAFAAALVMVALVSSSEMPLIRPCSRLGSTRGMLRMHNRWKASYGD